MYNVELFLLIATKRRLALSLFSFHFFNAFCVKAVRALFTVVTFASFSAFYNEALFSVHSQGEKETASSDHVTHRFHALAWLEGQCGAGAMEAAWDLDFG